jgi:transglutaminase superfamily protein
MRRPPGIGTLRAAWWAERAFRRARSELSDGGLRSVRLPPPPRLPYEAGRGVYAVLRRRDPSCLERSLVIQRWLAAHGDARDVVIGTSGVVEFEAHAWLDGDAASAARFNELTRLPAP